MLSKFNINPWKLSGTVIVGIYILYCLQNPNFSHIIDNLDLIIHEAGHFVFIIFGQYIQVLGGTLMQLSVPLLFVLYFFLRRDDFSGFLLLSWVGYNLVNISIYMGDAIKMSLPLLGGDGVIHDWNYLLGEIGLLTKTHVIANTVNFTGILLIAASLIFCFYFSFSPRRYL